MSFGCWMLGVGCWWTDYGSKVIITLHSTFYTLKLSHLTAGLHVAGGGDHAEALVAVNG